MLAYSIYRFCMYAWTAMSAIWCAGAITHLNLSMLIFAIVCGAMAYLFWLAANKTGDEL